MTMNISQTDKNRYIQECGAKNEHQTWGLFEAQSLFTEWMCEWSRDFHERQDIGLIGMKSLGEMETKLKRLFTRPWKRSFLHKGRLTIKQSPLQLHSQSILSAEFVFQRLPCTPSAFQRGSDVPYNAALRLEEKYSSQTRHWNYVAECLWSSRRP